MQIVFIFRLSMNKNKKLRYLLSFYFFYLVINNSFFFHQHILPDGEIICHAHFSIDSFHNSTKIPKHKHIKSELDFIFLVNDLFNNVLLLLIYFTFFIKRFFSLYHPDILVAIFICNNYFDLRAPPIR